MALNSNKVLELAPVPKKKNYLNNKDLLAEVVRSKEANQMNDKLALMLTMLCKKYAKKGNFAGYSYNDDMQGYAMLMLVKTWNSFDPSKSNNPFAFFTQCIKNSFIQYLKHEKRQRDVKNETLIAAGMNPSHGYMVTYEDQQHDNHEALLSSDNQVSTPVVTDPTAIMSLSVEPTSEKLDADEMSI